jgi:hypothetical protein
MNVDTSVEKESKGIKVNMTKDDVLAWAEEVV